MKTLLTFYFMTLNMMLFFTSCGLTPNPISPRQKLSDPGISIYDVPHYSFQELYAFFPDTNYTGLSNIYVSPTGNDTSGDGSSAMPYASIEKALSVAHSGSIIRIRAGLYQESLWINVSGTYSHPLVLYSEDGPGAARIDGGNADTVLATVSNFIVIDGLEIFNASKYGIGVYSTESIQGPSGSRDGSNVVIRNCIIHDVGEEGIKGAQNDFYLIENNEIYNVRLEQGIDCVGSFHVIILSNYLHDNAKGAGYCKGGSANVYWVGNLMTGIPENYFGIILGGESSLYVSFPGLDPHDIPEGYDQWVYNNVFIDFEQMGILIQNGEKLRIYNNTFYNCNYSGNNLFTIAEEWNKAFKPSSDIEIYNNIVKNDSSKTLKRFYFDPNHYEPAIIQHGYNSIDPGGSTFSWSYGVDDFIPADTDVLTNISFVDVLNHDYSLAPGSGGLDQASNLSSIVSNDIRGILRPQSGVMDRGAYEN